MGVLMSGFWIFESRGFESPENNNSPVWLLAPVLIFFLKIYKIIGNFKKNPPKQSKNKLK
jgi:hypothetical protein